MKQEYSSTQHTRWECKYHIVFIPKYRKRRLYGVIRKEIGKLFHDLARHKESVIEEGHVMPDHVHMLISIPPKYSVSNVMGYIKGKSAIWVARTFRGKEKNFAGERLWARGYFVSTVGRDENLIREYIKNQEKEDIRIDQLRLFR